MTSRPRTTSSRKLSRPKRIKVHKAKSSDKLFYRFSPWRDVCTLRERLRGAVWIYRFSPHVKKCVIRQHFGVSATTLLRYVEQSFDARFERFGLYFAASHAVDMPTAAKQFLQQVGVF
jgi:hypothetical protein